MNASTINVLHVEDDRAQRLIVLNYLKDLPGYEFSVMSAENEEQAIELFQRGQFELVILDYQLEEGDGLSCLRKIREGDSLLPVIAISGAASDKIAAELISAGADDYLSKKSLEYNMFAQSVQDVLTRRPQHTRPTPTVALLESENIATHVIGVVFTIVGIFLRNPVRYWKAS